LEKIRELPHEIAAPRTTDNGVPYALHPDRGVVRSMGAIIGFREIKGLAVADGIVIAPTIALGAATLAYHSAMAKVYHDREEAERRRNSERLGLFLRLHTSLSRVLIDIHRCILAVEMTLPQSSEKLEQIGVKARRKPNLLFTSLAHHITRDSTIPFATIKAEHMEVYNPPELPEVWSKIDLFLLWL
jgi:hypothetical protein